MADEGVVGVVIKFDRVSHKVSSGVRKGNIVSLLLICYIYQTLLKKGWKYHCINVQRQVV